MIHVVGANPNGGGVLTYIKNLSPSIEDVHIYAYTDYIKLTTTNYRKIQHNTDTQN